MLTIDKVIAIMTDQSLPNWKLYLKQGYGKPVLIAYNYFDPKKKEEQEPTEKEVEKALEDAIAKLNSQINHYRGYRDTSFEIELSTKKQNGGSVIGPIAFTLEPNQVGNTDSIAGLSGIGGLGAISELLDKRMEANNAMHLVNIERINFQHERDRELKEIEKKKEDLEKWEEKLKEKEKIYNSHSERVKNGLKLYGADKLFEFLPLDAPKETLKGTQTETQELPSTEEEQLIESIAGNIHKNVTDKNEIKVIGLIVQKFINEPNAQLFQDYRNKLTT